MHDVTPTEATVNTFEVEGFTPYAQIPRWILRSGGTLPAGAVQLYGVIMTYADNTTHAAFPSRERLATDMGVSVRSIGTYIKALEGFGAISVQRRRNRRTGNFYANHYVLRFTDPSVQTCRSEPEEAGFPRREEAGDPITTPTISTTPTVSTLDESRRELHPRSKERGLASKPDPISPAFHASPDRQRLLQRVGRIAYAKANNYTEEQREDVIYAFAADVEELFPGTECVDWLIYDRGWVPPKKAVNKFEAAKWLNMFLNALRIESGALEYKPAA